ncbi:Sphingomyelin synthase-related 1 [Lucilia cuprina]|nr:Sphingomyelin synthase-related 1 [Lucilia cuprina]
MNPVETTSASGNIPTIKCEENDICHNMDSINANDNFSNYTEKEDVSAVDVSQWQVEDVVEWATKVIQFTPNVIKCLQLEAIDGQCASFSARSTAVAFSCVLRQQKLRFISRRFVPLMIVKLHQKCRLSLEGCSANIPPEFFKTSISLGYSFVVTWITSFVMVIVHERVLIINVSPTTRYISR